MKNKQYFIGLYCSGTTFLCNMFTDFVDNIYNENYEYIKVRDRINLINKDFAFKFCEDFNNISEIKSMFPNSKIILIIRDLRDTVYSIFSGNPYIIPPRIFPAVNKIATYENISKFKAALKVTGWYYTDIEKCLEKHSNKIDKIIYYKDLINPIELKKIFDNLFPDKNLSLDYYKSKIKKTPNQKIWVKFTSIQKKEFKESFLNKLLVKYKFDTENW